MNIRLRLVCSILLGCLCVSPPAVAEIIEGVGVLIYNWDFSEDAAVGIDDGDIGIVYVVDPPLGYWVMCLNGAQVTIVQDSTFEEVTTAPEDSSLYDWDAPAFFEVCYVVRTEEGHYAKFGIVELSATPVIEYAYQTDGSRILAGPVAVQQSPWASIKARYLERDR